MTCALLLAPNSSLQKVYGQIRLNKRLMGKWFISLGKGSTSPSFQYSCGGVTSAPWACYWLRRGYCGEGVDNVGGAEALLAERWSSGAGGSCWFRLQRWRVCFLVLKFARTL